MGQFPVTRTESSRYDSIDYDNLRFGVYFTDHMFCLDYSDGRWHSPRIEPNAPLSIDPANLTLHYGQAVFEGMKAFRHADGSVCLFRPEDHIERLNRSAQKLCIPDIPVDLVVQSLKELIQLDKRFVPTVRGHSLYIRPFIIAMDNALGVRPSNTYRLMVLLSPVAAYYPEGLKPVKLHVARHHVRCARGGLGEAKTLANYAASLLPAKSAIEKGFSQVLWLDPIERKYIEEVGTMNIFFKIKGEIVTPPLEGGTILSGITRRCVIEICREWGLEMREERLSIDRLFSLHESGDLDEVFGTGTAAVISPVGLIHHDGRTITLNDMEIGPMAQKLYDYITSIQYGEEKDPYGWNVMLN